MSEPSDGPVFYQVHRVMDYAGRESVVVREKSAAEVPTFNSMLVATAQWYPTVSQAARARLEQVQSARRVLEKRLKDLADFEDGLKQLIVGDCP